MSAIFAWFIFLHSKFSYEHNIYDVGYTYILLYVNRVLNHIHKLIFIEISQQLKVIILFFFKLFKKCTINAR